MNYCTIDDVYLVFGRSNVRQWADLNNNNVDADIVARQDWAIEQASSEFDSRLADSQYQFPLDDASDLPPVLVRYCASLAGVLLYESRGVTDTDSKGNAMHALGWHRKQYETFVLNVLGRRVALLGVTLRSDAVVPIDGGPSNVCFPDPATVVVSNANLLYIDLSAPDEELGGWS